MPELPEVETVKRILEPQLSGQTILSAEVLHHQIIFCPDADSFQKKLIGQIITSMSRRGKYLTVHFGSGDRLIVHLRMTGQLLVVPDDFPVEKHTHLIAKLSGGNEIRYIDVRRFGRFWLFGDGEEDNISGIAKLGLEPDDKGLTAEYLKSRLCKIRKTIKEMLHDQSIVAGIGNIYSDEILFASGIHPEKKCSDMSDEEFAALAKHIPEIIRWGIETNKMTAEEYLNGKGKKYRNTPYLKAYGREGKPCVKCGAVLEKLVIGGRSSVFCPNCQKYNR